ncbi:hypothetical protein WOLCODRAFT_103043 [Wolfiporia cocos MD-104 SS10]|uniref:Cysteine-rich protein 1 n=1 Tax=Wolfiporia cocos (strain MD-104) TaxID=742152 RepID=A0A2H3K3S1_WOLCO|nr:hypothetical protein WOLCODRAFT_103043 [Wolfiporia cocos MD-104 SS10]
MHPFGGTPICPRCNKAVYAAEQIMGPGRKLYHKPCLACMSCGKRLDSYNLVEHDQEPYCNICHVKLFGTRDTRLANLPHRDDTLLSPPASPPRSDAPLAPTTANVFSANSPANAPNINKGSGPPLPPRRDTALGRTATTLGAPVLRPTRALSPVQAASAERTKAFIGGRTTPPALTRSPSPGSTQENEQTDTYGTAETPVEAADEAPSAISGAVATPTHTGRGQGGLPRTIPLPLSPVRTRFAPTRSSASSISSSTAANPPPLPARHTPHSSVPSVTSYPSAAPALPARHTPANSLSGNPKCPRCSTTVYFAEAVKAVGKTWHKGCLRCSACNVMLDSSRLAEREGEPVCVRCYGKLYGPRGGGYALLGKAGG